MMKAMYIRHCEELKATRQSTTPLDCFAGTRNDMKEKE